MFFFLSWRGGAPGAPAPAGGGAVRARPGAPPSAQSPPVSKEGEYGRATGRGNSRGGGGSRPRARTVSGGAKGGQGWRGRGAISNRTSHDAFHGSKQGRGAGAGGRGRAEVPASPARARRRRRAPSARRPRAARRPGPGPGVRAPPAPQPLCAAPPPSPRPAPPPRWRPRPRRAGPWSCCRRRFLIQRLQGGRPPRGARWTRGAPRGARGAAAPPPAPARRQRRCCAQRAAKVT